MVIANVSIGLPLHFCGVPLRPPLSLSQVHKVVHTEVVGAQSEGDTDVRVATQCEWCQQLGERGLTRCS